VIVGDHAEQAHGSALACAALLAAEKIEPVLSLCTRDRNAGPGTDVLGACALGVKTFFCMSARTSAGGFPKHGRLRHGCRAADQALAKMASAGLDFSGTKLPAAPALTVAAAAHRTSGPWNWPWRRRRKRSQRARRSC